MNESVTLESKIEFFYILDIIKFISETAKKYNINYYHIIKIYDLDYKYIIDKFGSYIIYDKNKNYIIIKKNLWLDKNVKLYKNGDKININNK